MTYIHPDHCKSDGKEMAELIASNRGLVVLKRRLVGKAWHYELGEGEG